MYDAVIVGSGFGGAVMAYRLARAGQSVLVLERGRAYAPDDFPRSPRDMAANFWDPGKGLRGMFDVRSFRRMEAVVAAGLGGGSLIYANVLLRKPAEWFGGWPVTRAELDPHYDAVESVLRPRRVPPELEGDRTRAFASAASRSGLEAVRAPLAITFHDRDGSPSIGAPIDGDNRYGTPRSTCRMCGECVIGCRYGSKNTLDLTYVSMAERLGAEVRTGCDVRLVGPARGGYGVTFRSRGIPAGGYVSGRRVILSAGALGSTEILLRSRKGLPNLSPALGSRFSGNGDYHTLALRGGVRIDPSRGPVITAYARSGNHYVEDAGYPEFVNWMIRGADPGIVARGARYVWQELMSAIGVETGAALGSELSRLIGSSDAADRSLPLLGMGMDAPSGSLSLEGGELSLDWPDGASSPYFDAVRTTMRRISDALGATWADDPLSWLNKAITVHPLGGCPMGSDSCDAVVDRNGEVFGHPGLFVADGSVMPGPVGPNPALTIAAMADMFADAICRV